MIKRILKKIRGKISNRFQFRQSFVRFNTESAKLGLVQAAWEERYPIFGENGASTKFDPHYLYHPAWATRIVKKINPKKHVDISSILSFSANLSAFVPVDFYDYRPATLFLDNLTTRFADLLTLPFPSNSVESLSCMHTIEHVGLGRYGDPMDPAGDRKACAELWRVLSKDGNLLIVVPVGKSNIRFNAHRIYSFDQVMTFFPNATLQEFTLIPDNAGEIGMIMDLQKNIEETRKLVDSQEYGCGCFWFKKTT